MYDKRLTIMPWTLIYARVTREHKKELDEYVRRLEKIRVSGLHPDEQKAYWIN